MGIIEDPSKAISKYFAVSNPEGEDYVNITTRGQQESGRTVVTCWFAEINGPESKTREGRRGNVSVLTRRPR